MEATVTAEFTEEQRTVLDRVEKLLRLAGKNTNEAEAASATAKAMSLLAEYNLNLSSVDETGEGSGRRAEEKVVGGFYEFEQDLWRRIADLNYVLCWHQKTWVERTTFDAKADRIIDHWRRTHILRGQFKFVGRVVNIAGTKAMGNYLLGTIDRLTRERLQERGVTERMNTQLRTRWAVSYREGIAARVGEKLWDRRQEQIAEERRTAEEAERRAREAGMKGASTETAISLSTLRQTERDANMDFMYGEGYTARQAAASAERARKAQEAEAAYTAWAAAHPEEARKQEEERRKEERKRSSRSYRSTGRAEKERDWGAYRAGYEKGDSVGIDQQAGSSRSAGGIGHTAGALGHG
jgi:hypothetical protein